MVVMILFYGSYHSLLYNFKVTEEAMLVLLCLEYTYQALYSYQPRGIGQESGNRGSSRKFLLENEKRIVK